MTQQEMEARIEKLERQLLFVSALAATAHVTVKQLARQHPTKEDIKVLNALVDKANGLGISIEELMP